MTHPDHELYEFKKRVRKGQNLITVVVLILFPLILFFMFGAINAMAGPLVTSVIFIFSFSVFVVQTASNYLDLKRSRYHRFYGPSEKLIKRLEPFFIEHDMAYKKDPEYMFQRPLNPFKTKSINYDMGSFSINVFPFQGMGFADIRIISHGLLEENLDNIEEMVFDLIKDKRGWDER